jgi:pimeloyl-ACP methyl ester carboxylesterase
MALYALIHGAGDSGGYWNHVKPLLEAAGHDVVTPDMPIDRDDATLMDCADVVIEAIGDRSDVIVVSQSFGGFVAPIVADRVKAKLLAYVAGTIPKPGESFNTWFGNTGYEDTSGGEFDVDAIFYHDVSEEVTAEAKTFARDQSESVSNDPLPLSSMPDVPTRAVIGSIDRLFPAEFAEKVVQDRLGFAPDRIESGHCIAQARPQELAEWLESQRKSVGA